MNLFRRHNKFEDELHKQLGDMEVKPSISLWDRIDSSITKDGFENDVQHTLENFEQMPYPETWDKIVAELPEEKVAGGYTKYYIIVALVLLFGTGIYLGANWNKQTENNNAVLSNNQLAHTTENVEQKEYPSGIDKLNAKQQSTEVSIKKGAAKMVIVSSVKPQNTPLKMVSNLYGPQIKKPKKGISKNANIARSKSQNISNIDKTSSNNLIASDTRKDITVFETSPTIINTTSNLAQLLIDTPSLVKNSSTANDSTVLLTATANTIQPAAKEIAQVNTDSINKEVLASNKAEQSEVLTHFSVSVFGGVNYGFSTYASPQKSSLDFTQNIAFRKQLERPAIDWSGGFMIDYRLSQKWMISAGLMMLNFYQKFDYSTSTAVHPANGNEIGAPVINPNDSVTLGNSYSNRIKYSWTEIPVYINYKISEGRRIDFDIQGGASYAFISTIDAGIVSYDNKGVLILKDKESFPQIKNAVFVTLQPQLSYKFGQAVSIGILPVIKYSTTSIIGNKNWIQQHPYFMGVSICLRKRF